MRDSADETTLSPRFVGGTHLTFAASEIVRIYLETGSYMKSTFDDDIDCQARNCVSLQHRGIRRSSTGNLSRKTCSRQVLEPRLRTLINGGVSTPARLRDLNYFMDR